MSEPSSESDLFHRQRERLFFTWSVQAEVTPLEITDALGARFKTAAHGWLWDLESQVYNVSAGHREGRIQERMIAQIQSLPAAAPNAILPIRAELGELLHRHTGLHRAFLTTGGSEANENAIKIARLVTGRSKVITRRSSYHGATLAILGIAGDDRKRPFAGDLAPAIHIEDPYPLPATKPGEPSAWVRSLEAVLRREGPETIAAILLEGFTGANGMQVPPPDFWPRVRELCDAHGILLIDDEIFSGFGRTGRWFACDRWGVRPDIMTLGKALTSGYAPLAAVCVNRAIADHFDDRERRHKLWCGLTTYAHPVSCAAAVGALEVYADDDLPGNAERVGKVFAGHLEELQKRPALRGLVRDQRGFGLMRLLELDRPAQGVAALGLAHGLYIPTRGNTVLLCPPLCLSAEEAGVIATALGETLAAFVS